MSKLKFGCVVFEIGGDEKITLQELHAIDYEKYEDPSDYWCYEDGGYRDFTFATHDEDGRLDNVYMADGRYSCGYKLPSIFVANKRNRKALVTLYGEKAVPQLPVKVGL